ncbi:uncharacterized protein B0H64DRAFT_416481 [Chaetomium fimeti]|uniref:Aminoglycoside phosphotransferase domain-containing protein n=1 Tax=Chaetomium fimeti TaxID=1854472 RepID=A0AAE0HIU4_9PEZI|nr:hypothetical protein B0H64DRAFT_416481 [Chaetomium fimeti]
MAVEKPDIPYICPANLRPGPLPEVRDLLLAGKRHNAGPDCGKTPMRFDEHYDANSGGSPCGLFQEAENMLFVQQSTNVPVPKIYAMFHDKKTGIDFVIQEFVPGHKLGDVWEYLDLAQKGAIALQLRRHFDELRSIPSPGYYAGIWKQRVPHDHFTGYYADHFTGDRASHDPIRDQAILGPHETEEEWTRAMVLCLDFHQPARYELPVKDRYYPTVFKGHESVFTHGNLRPDNLVLREDKTVVIVDWWNSGWYPSYWEYSCAMKSAANKDWTKWVHDMVLDEYAHEEALMTLGDIVYRG